MHLPHRPKISVRLGSATTRAGGRLDVQAVLDCARPTMAERVTISLEGRTRRYHHQVTTGKMTTARYYDEAFYAYEDVFTPGELGAGSHVLETAFVLPSGAPPTYRSDTASVAYELAVHVEIPWWPDARAAYTIVVEPAQTPPVRYEPQRHVTREGVRGTDLFIEASLASYDVSSHGVLEGAFSMANLAHHRVKHVSIGIVTVETPLVDSAVGTRETHVTALDVPPPAADNVSVPFLLRAPELTPSFRTAFFAVESFMRIRAVVSWGGDLDLFIPVRVIAPSVEPPRAAQLPPLGREKLELVWASILSLAQQSGLNVVSSDLSAQRLVLDVSGLPVLVQVEGRARQGERFVATIDYDSLGLGLSVSERTWSDLGSGWKVEGAERFTVRGRDPEQVRPFVQALLEPLSAQIFEQLGVNDDALVVAGSADADDAGEVLRFLMAVRTLALVTREAISRIAPPAQLEGAAPRYEAFAASRALRVRPGDLAISGISVRGLPCAIETVFDGAVAVATLAHVTTGAPMSDDTLAALAGEHGCTITAAPEHLTARFPLVQDPQRILPFFQAVADAVLGPESPYR